jgi:hypothetical protein
LNFDRKTDEVIGSLCRIKIERQECDAFTAMELKRKTASGLFAFEIVCHDRYPLIDSTRYPSNDCKASIRSTSAASFTESTPNQVFVNVIDRVQDRSGAAEFSVVPDGC